MFSWLSFRQTSSSFCMASTSSCRKSSILPSGLTLRVSDWMAERSRSTSRCATSCSLRRDASVTACDLSCITAHRLLLQLRHLQHLQLQQLQQQLRRVRVRAQLFLWTNNQGSSVSFTIPCTHSPPTVVPKQLKSELETTFSRP